MTKPPIIAYHGSGSDFNEFSTDHPNSGFGQQAVGRGMYFAENEGVAQKYKALAAKANRQIHVTNKAGDILPDDHPATSYIKDMYSTHGGSLNHSDITSYISQHKRYADHSRKSADELRDYIKEDPASAGWAHKQIADDLKAAGAHDAVSDVLSKGYRGVPYGHMYQVELHADPDKMLHWHEPVDKQPDNIKRMMSEVLSHPEASKYKPPEKGGNLYDIAKFVHQKPDTRGFGGTETDYDAVRRLMDKHNVHGIKWKASDSAVAPDWDSHNYTIWDPKKVKVVRKYAMGGFIKRASGGVVDAALRVAKANGGSTTVGMPLHVGPIHSSVAGRTDHLPVHVPSGSYVIPADIVGALGEGNTMAGFKHLRRMFGGTPYAPGADPYGQGSTPYNEPLPGRKSGGEVDSVPCVVAGGEYVVSPHQVMHAGGGDLDVGHRVLDEFVKRMRAKTIKTLENLPNPKRD